MEAPNLQSTRNRQEREPRTRKGTGRAGEDHGLRWAITPFLKRGPAKGPVRHQSQRGNLPGREEVWTGFRQLRSAAFHLPHRTTGPAWPCRMRANAPVSESHSWGPLLYGVVRASTRFPIQSGPPNFAPYPG
ncbi:hypothetical protein BO94DRAFT_594618, partial [Aspergillus sclerotioniger CBS 115572]